MKEFGLGFLKFMRFAMVLVLVVICGLTVFALFQGQDQFSIDEYNHDEIRMAYNETSFRTSDAVESVSLYAYEEDLKSLYIIVHVTQYIIPLILGFMVFHILIGNFSAIVEQKRFENIKLKKLKTLACWICIYDVVYPYIDLASIWIFTGRLSSPSIGVHIGQNFLLGLMIYLLAEVFEHGAYLQAEYDATV